LLHLTTRQVRRLVRRIKEHGDQGLIHRLRGRPSKLRLEGELRQKVLAEYRRLYQGFGPTFACFLESAAFSQFALGFGAWEYRRKKGPRFHQRGSLTEGLLLWRQ
jgi:hypothetical protein